MYTYEAPGEGYGDNYYNEYFMEYEFQNLNTLTLKEDGISIVFRRKEFSGEKDALVSLVKSFLD